MWVILLATIGIILFEVPSLLRKGLKKELAVFSILLIIGVMYSTFYALDVELANPWDIIAQILKPLTDLLDNAFK